MDTTFEKIAEAMDAQEAKILSELSVAVGVARDKLTSASGEFWDVYFSLCEVAAIDKRRCRDAGVREPSWDETMCREGLLSGAVVDEFLKSRSGGQN